MATLSVNLIASSTDATADVLGLNITDSLTVVPPMSSIARVSISQSSATNILTSGTNTVDTYVYLRNTDATNFVEVKTDAAAVLIKLAAGEFAFFPVKGAVGLEIQADTAACIVEYGYWTKG